MQTRALLLTIQVLRVTKTNKVAPSFPLMDCHRYTKRIDIPDFLSSYPFEDNVDFNTHDIIVYFRKSPKTRSRNMVKDIFNEIEAILGVTPEQIKSSSQTARIVFGRQLFHHAYIALNLGCNAIAGMETNNDRSTVNSSLKTIQNIRDTDNGWRKNAIKQIDDWCIKTKKKQALLY